MNPGLKQRRITSPFRDNLGGYLDLCLGAIATLGAAQPGDGADPREAASSRQASVTAGRSSLGYARTLVERRSKL